MTTLYKITDSKNQTKNKTQWGECVTHSGTGDGRLCGPGYIHAYMHPYLASFFNPIHVDFKNPNLWEAEGEIALKDGQLKCGCVSLTTIKQIPLPKITTDQRREIGIRCALLVYDEPGFVEWANKWLSGEDRSTKSAEAAEAESAARAASWSAARVAWAAARAAAVVARAAEAESAARSAARSAAAAEAESAAKSAARAASWAVAAAAAAALSNKDIDILQIIKDVVDKENKNAAN